MTQILGLLLAVGSTALEGWVFSVLWGWFLVKQLHLPELSTPLAIGIGMTVKFLTYQYDAGGKERGGEEGLLHLLLRPLIILGYGWLVYHMI